MIAQVVSRRLGWLVVLVSACGSPARPVVRVGRVDGAALERATRKAGELARIHDDHGAAEAYLRVLAVNPDDAQALYLLAVSALRAGDRGAAIGAVSRLAEIHSDLVPTADDFAALVGDPAFDAAVKRIATRAAAYHTSSEALQLAERGLLAEGIAYDPVGQAFYVGSAARRKIVKLTTGGDAVDFTSPRSEIDAVGGLRVDARRRRLWAVTGTYPRMDGFVAGEPERNTLIEFDLKTAAVVGRYPLIGPASHGINDVAIDASGRPFVTDTESGQLYTVQEGGQTLTPVFATPPFFRPNGLAFDHRGQLLFVADATGVYRVDVAARSVLRLGQPTGSSLGIFDGMYFVRDSGGARLVAIQSLTGPGRVVSARLTPALDAVTRVDVLESAHPLFDGPTTGAVVGRWLYVIANSQLWGPRVPHATIILKTPLDVPAELPPVAP